MSQEIYPPSTLPVLGPLTDAELRASEVPVIARLLDGAGNAITSHLLGSARAVDVCIVDGSGDPISSFGGGTQYTEDDPAASNPVGTALNLIRADSLGGVTSTDGDNIAARGTDKGEVYVKHADTIEATQSGSWTVTADAGTNLNTSTLALESGGNLATIAGVVRAEESGHTSGHAGVMALAVRNDGGMARAGDTNYIPLTTDSTGALRVTGGGGSTTQYTEDDSSAGGESLCLAGAVRRDAAASSSGTDGDYSTLSTDSTGRLWTHVGHIDGGTINTISNPVTVENAGTFAVQASQGGTWNVGTVTTVSTITNVVHVDDNSSSLTVDNGGTFAVQAAQSGTWNITNVSGTVSLPTGAATSAKQDTGNASLASVDGKITACNTGAVVIASGSITANAGTNLNTSALALESGGNLAGAAAALAVMDDWDESDRCKVNPISGQAGVAGGSGVVGATTQRVVLATDVALPAGANAIGKLAANSGVDVGDVDVTSVTPGTAATSLGKAEDAAHASGDVGVMSLAVRSDAGGTLVSDDGDYSPLSVNELGQLRVTSGETSEFTILASAARTADTSSSDLTNTDAVGVFIWLNVTVSPGGGQTLRVFVQAKDPISGSWVTLFGAPTVTATGVYGVDARPAAAETAPGGASAVIDRRQLSLPRTWKVLIDHSGAGSWTYSVAGGYVR